MPVTFKSGPRDPVTGQSSAVISPGNVVQPGGRTNDEISQMASQGTADPGQEQEYRQAEQNYRDFLKETGRTETNPYGKQGFFSRVLGIDPSNINYVASTPGGIATLNQVNALAYDQYMNPRDAQGNIRGMLREGSPTRSGTVVYDPTMETDLGIAGMIPYVGGLMRMANRRSALNISPYDNPLFSDMSDMGNELGAFPLPADEIAAAAKEASSAFDNMDPVPSVDELIEAAYPPEPAASITVNPSSVDTPEIFEVSDASNFLSPTMDQLRPVFRSVGETLNMNLPGFDSDPNKPRIEPFYEQDADRYGVRLKIPFGTMVG